MQFVHFKVKEGCSVCLFRKALGLSSSGYYAWRKRPAALISSDTLMFYCKAEQLFGENRNSLGSRELMKALRKQEFAVGRHKMRTITRKLGLVVRQRVAYKV